MLDSQQARAIKAVEEFAAGTLVTSDGRRVTAMSIYPSAPVDGRPRYAVSLLLSDGQVRSAVSFYANGTLMTTDGRPVFAVQLFDSAGLEVSLGAPTLAALGGSLTVPENSANGTVCGTVTGMTTSSTLSLSDTAGGRFAIHATTGVVTVANGSLLDRETATSHSITVVETLVGATNTPRSTILSVAVTNVNEVILAALGGTFSLAENAAAAAVAGALTGVTSGSTLSLDDSAGGRVALSGSNIVRGATALNYEFATSHSFTVREAKADATDRTTTLSLTVTNIAEITLAALGGTFSLAESAAANTVAGGLTGVTSGSTLSLVDDAGGKIALIGNNVVRGAAGLDYETATSHSFTVRETNAEGSNSPRDTVLSLTVVNELEGTTLAKPILTLTSAAGDAQPDWDSTYPGTTVWDAVTSSGCKVRMRFRIDSGSGYGAYTTEAFQNLTSDILIEGTFTWPLFDATVFPSGGNVEIQEQQVRYDTGVEVDSSDWSDAIVDLIEDVTPAAFTFTDVTGATASTLQTSNLVTITGLGSGITVAGTITDGEYQKNGGTWDTVPFIATNSDTFKVRHTSAALAGNSVSTVLTIGGVSDTYTSTVSGTFAPSSLFGGGELGYVLDPTDTTKLWQTIAGATAPANGQPLGRVDDISGLAKHFAASADDTTRPTYDSTEKTIVFDGTNDKLYRDQAFLHAAVGATLMFAVRGAASQLDKRFFAETSTSSTSPFYQPYTGTDPAASALLNCHIRNNTAANQLLDLGPSAYDNTLKIVEILDTGTTLEVLINGVSVEGPTAYTRSGTTTLNRTSLGALFRTTAGSFFAGRIGRMAAINRQLTSGERSSLRSWIAAGHGISL